MASQVEHPSAFVQHTAPGSGRRRHSANHRNGSARGPAVSVRFRTVRHPFAGGATPEGRLLERCVLAAGPAFHERSGAAASGVEIGAAGGHPNVVSAATYPILPIFYMFSKLVINVTVSSYSGRNYPIFHMF